MEKVTAQENLKQVTNPYLPSWEYVPDGEPYVFGDRVYVYGSHDFFNGDLYCMGDYVCWSAPVDDLGQWRYEGVIYRKDQDPHNGDLQGNLYAPDVTIGPDGRYYLYYVLSNVNVLSLFQKLRQHFPNIPPNAQGTGLDRLRAEGLVLIDADVQRSRILNGELPERHFDDAGGVVSYP